MTLQELLNSDMDLASILALLRQGLSWWADELAAMLPRSWRDRFSSRPRLWIEPAASGGWRYWKDGRPFEGEPPATARLGLLAPPDTVLIREVTAPRMAAADVRRLLSLDIDRLSPLSPDLIYFDVEVADRGDDQGVQRALLGILPRAEAARLLAQARDAGHAPARFAVRSEDPDGPPRFDFLPQVLEAAGEVRGGRVRLYLWGAAAALILLNIALLVGRDMVDVSRMRAMVESQRPLVSAVTRLRRRVEGEDARRRDLIALGRHNEPLRVLSALTQALPAGAWTQHLEWNGQTLRLIGFKREDIDLPTLLRGGGVFVNPRVLTPEPGAAPSLLRPFDIAVDAAPEARP